MPLLDPEVLRYVVPLDRGVAPDHGVFSNLRVRPELGNDKLRGDRKADEYGNNEKRLFHSPPYVLGPKNTEFVCSRDGARRVGAAELRHDSLQMRLY